MRTFLVAGTILLTRALQKEGFVWVHSSRIVCRGRKGEGAGHILSATRKQVDMDASFSVLSTQSGRPAFRVVPPTFRLCLPSSDRPLEAQLQVQPLVCLLGDSKVSQSDNENCPRL